LLENLFFTSCNILYLITSSHNIQDKGNIIFQKIFNTIFALYDIVKTSSQSENNIIITIDAFENMYIVNSYIHDFLYSKRLMKLFLVDFSMH